MADLDVLRYFKVSSKLTINRQVRHTVKNTKMLLILTVRSPERDLEFILGVALAEGLARMEPRSIRYPSIAEAVPWQCILKSLPPDWIYPMNTHSSGESTEAVESRSKSPAASQSAPLARSSPKETEPDDVRGMTGESGEPKTVLGHTSLSGEPDLEINATTTSPVSVSFWEHPRGRSEATNSS